MKYSFLPLICFTLSGTFTSVSAQVPAPVVKVSTPTIPLRPKFFFLETPSFNLLVHHGEGESLADGSLVINGYKNDPNTTNPIDLWIFGTVLKRQGELQSVVVTKYVEQGEDLLFVLFFRYRGMENATVVQYRPETHGLSVFKELQDIGTTNSLETVRLRCSHDPRIANYFLVPGKAVKPTTSEPAKIAAPLTDKKNTK